MYGMGKVFTIKHFARFIVILAIGAILSNYLPTIEFVSSATLSSSTIVVILFVFLVGFLINQAIRQNWELNMSVSRELSRLRRVVHLSESTDNQEKWKKDVRKASVAYLEAVGKKDFRDYDEGHEAFRELTHELYNYHPKDKRNDSLFSEILNSTRDLAFQRQQVSRYRYSSISPYTKFAATFVAIIAIVLLLGARGAETSIFFIAGPVSGILLILDIFFQLDVLTEDERHRFEAMYIASAKDMKKGS